MTLLATSPYSLDGLLDGLNLGAIDAFSGRSAKQHASAIVWEEIYSLNTRIQAYESQIHAWRQTINILKSLHNTLCDISKLPADILIDIWLYLAEDSGESVESLKQWLGITHVCSHWRKLARNSQKLWKWPCILRPQLASSLLDLAGASSITLFVDVGKIDDLESEELRREAFGLAARLLHRTDALTFRTTDEMTTEISTEFVDSLEQKETIQGLKFMTIYYQNILRPWQFHAFNVIDLVQYAPKLQVIFLRNRTILDSPSRMLPLPLLTSLEIIITESDYRSAPRSPLHNVLSTLRMFSNLQQLILDDVFQPLTEEDEEWCKAHSEPLSFSSMQTLWIVSSVRSLQIFFQQVAYPPTAQITVEIASTTMDGERQQSDSSFLHALELLIITTCNVGRTGEPVRYLEVYETSTEDGEWPLYYVGFSTGQNFENPTLAFFWPRTEGRPKPFPNLPGTCPLDQLKGLHHAIGPGEFDAGMWKAFGCLPNLKQMTKINVEDHPALLKVMSSFRPSGESIFESPILTQHDLSTKQDQLAVPQLYFPKLVHVPQPKSLPAREFLDRIMLVRRAWNRLMPVEGC